MKIKHLLSFFAAGALLLASCTEENEINGGTSGKGDGTVIEPDRQEVLLSIKNGLVLKTPASKADDQISTEEENYIHSLDVYVFGSTTEDGLYTFQEMHYYRADGSTVSMPNTNTFSFNLTNDPASNAITTGLLKINKGLFVKLYCVANRSKFFTTDDSGTTTEFTDFQSLEQTKPGQADNVISVAGKPTEEDFKKLHIQLIDPMAIDENNNDVLASPLPMSGAYITPLDLTDFGTSARTMVSFKLSRMVARFDIVNDASKSKFTLEKISMGNGQKGAHFFPIETVGKSDADLITYPERTVSALTQQTPDQTTGATDKTLGAFYSYPSPKADKGYLMLKGKYAVNMTESKEVSYQVPFQQMVNGIGSYIEVAYNHRYTIEITKADTYNLDVTLKVAEWDEADEIDEYDPENDFEKDAKVTLNPDQATTVGAYVLDNGQISVLPDANSKFAFTMGSNTELQREIVYKSNAAVKWLVEAAEPVVTKASSIGTTYSFRVDADAITTAGLGAKLEVVTIRLTNPASGQRKEIKVIPTKGPEVSFVSQEDNYNKFDPATLTAYIYNLANQTIKLNVTAETRLKEPNNPASELVTGSEAEVQNEIKWVTASSNVADESGEYTLTVTGTGTNDAEATVNFKSVASTAITPVKVILKDAAIKALAAENFKSDRIDNTFSLDAGTGSIPKVSLVGVADNNFTLTVTSPEGVNVEKAGDWLSVNSQENGKPGQIVTTIRGSITNAKDMATTPQEDGKITIINKVGTSEKIEVEVVTTVPATPTVSFDKNHSGKNTYNDRNSTASLYNVKGQSITLTTDIDATLTGKSNADMLNITSSGKEHTITLNTKDELSTTPKLVFTTTDGATKDITVNFVDPAITALTSDMFTAGSENNTFTKASEPNNAKVVMKEATAKSSFTLTVTSKEGITLGSETANWLKVTLNETDATPGSHSTTVTVAIADNADLKEAKTGTIVLKNAIPDGGDMTIDVATTLPEPEPEPAS